MFCKYCGHKMENTNAPCPNCGYVYNTQQQKPLDFTYDNTQQQRQPDFTYDNMQQYNTGAIRNPFWVNLGKNFGLLFLAAFLSQFSYIPLSIILYTTKKPVPQIISPVLMLLSFFLFVIAMGIYFARRYNDGNLKVKGILQRSLSAFTGVLLLGLVTLIFAVLYKEISRFIPDILSDGSKQIPILAVVIVAGILLTFLSFIILMLVVAGFRFSLSSAQIAGAFGVILTKSIVLFPLVLLFSLISGAGLYLLSLVQVFYSRLLVPILPYSFSSGFILYLLGSFTGACFLLLVIVLSDIILDRCNEKIRQVAVKRANKQIPIFLTIILVLTIVLYIYAVPLGGGAESRIISEIKLNMELANTYSASGMDGMSIYEYRQAYSKILSFKGFLKGEAQLLDESTSITYKNQYAPFFKGVNSLNIKDYYSAAEWFKQLQYYPAPLSGSYFGLLEAYNGLNDVVSAKALIERMIGQEMFFDDMSGLRHISDGRKNALIQELDKLELAVGPKMAYAAFEKTKYNDMNGALNDLMALQKKYTNDPLVSYYIAKVASEYKYEQSNYQVVKDYTAAFASQSAASGQTVDEVNLRLVTSFLYLAANDPQSAQNELSSLYQSYPDDAEVARQYAYILNFQNNPDEALKILNRLTAKDSGDYYAWYLTASAQAIKKDASAALGSMAKFIDITAKDKDLKPTLDKMLYNFSLDFSKILTPDVLTQVEAIKSNTLLYNYIYAIKGWKEQNSEMSNQYIDQVLKADGELGYALYIKGVNNYEQTVRTGKTDFSEAEKYYKKSLSILPNHVEGYFALAHCYKKWGKNLDALRAFRMVTILLPFEDHRTDPYGMTVHAQGEVNSLLQYDIKDGE